MMLQRVCSSALLVAMLVEFAAAQDSEVVPDVSVNVGPAGVQRFSRDGWAALSVVGVNQTDEDAERVVSVYLDQDTSLQYAKRFWIPARSRRQTWLPIHVPEGIRMDQNRIDVSHILIDVSGGKETFGENAQGMAVRSRSVMLTDEEVGTGLVLNSNRPDRFGTPEEVSDEIYDKVYQGRDLNLDLPLGLSLINFRTNLLPQTHQSLDELDQIVIAGDHLLGDTQGIVTLREWLRDGGRMWIQLDLTSPEFVEQLLGDDARCTVVDRVELNEFEFDVTDASPLGGGSGAVERWTSEEPVEMVRVLADDAEVTCRATGWPAVFWQPFGRGEIVFTTLGAKVWIPENGVPYLAYQQLSRRFFEPRDPPPDFSQAMVPILNDQIGYKIPSRGVAAWILGLNVLILLAAGIVWARQRRLERLAVLIPVTAFASTAALLLIGSRQAGSVPSTVATGQLVRVASAGEAQVDTVRAVYSGTAGELDLVSSAGAVTLSMDSDDSSSGVRRLQWDDNGQNQWKGVTQPPGVVRLMQSTGTLPLASPIVARGTFDQQGFVASLVGIDPTSCEDPVLVAPPGPATGIVAGEQGTFRADADAALPAEQFYGGALLSDAQRMRQSYLRSVLASPELQPFGREPRLLVWGPPFDLGVEFSERFQQRGTALFSLPIELDRPPAGQNFVLPATFIRTEAFASERGITAVFNPRTGKWLPQLTKPTEAELLLRFPRALLPIKLQTLRLAININAPSRTLRIKTLDQDDRPQVVFEQASPVGLLEVEIDGSRLRSPDPEGGLWMAVEITESENAARLRAESKDQENAQLAADKDSTTWQIESIIPTAVARVETAVD